MSGISNEAVIDFIENEKDFLSSDGERKNKKIFVYNNEYR